MTVRSEPKVMTEKEITEFLTQEVTGRLGLAYENRAYVVPLAFVYLEGKIYFHWFTEEGKKAKMLAHNPQVCFEVDAYSVDHLDRRSVIIEGVAAPVTSEQTVKTFMLELAKKYPAFAPGKSGNHPKAVQVLLTMGMPFLIKKIKVYQIEPETISGKTWSR